MFIRYGSFVQLEHPIRIGHEFDRFVHRIELNGIIQEEKVGLLARVLFHLVDQYPLLVAIYRADGLVV